MSLKESYLNSLDDQPKDLTVKTAKKLKPIPPPLNLDQEDVGKMPVSVLSEFAAVATSPKSPLMQKHLPFRKRAHSIPESLVEPESEVPVPPVMSSHRAVLGCGVLDLSTHASSALLSPAPYSSREDSSVSWPSPAWHCFQPGVRVKVGGCWRPVTEMPSPQGCDWPGELLVERVTLSPPQLVCCALSSGGEISVELPPSHPLLVKDRGWVALCPDSFHKRYGLKCLSVQPGDIILPPSVPLPLPIPSPDICERIKRFSFPTLEECPVSPAVLLSPPTTPTRKTQDSGDKPKRPMNAFMLFAKRYRLELIQTNPGKDNRAISVILGEAWRSLPQHERDKYIQGARDLSHEQKLLYPDCWKRKRSHSTS